MSHETEMIESYGPFQAGRTYKIYSKNLDSLTMKCKGFVYHVPIVLTKEHKPWVADAVEKKGTKSHSQKKSHSQQPERPLK